MELKYLKLVKTIVEEGNMSNSADRLFLTQSALSHQLRDLEETLGFKVFYRSRNNWELTEEGKELYSLANKVFTEIAHGLDKIQNVKNGSKGNIRISTECYSFYQGLPGFIQKMGILYPEINIHLVIEATHQPIAKLLSNELDIAIVTEKPTHESLTPVKLFDDEIYAIMHKEYFLGTKDFIEYSDFSRVHLIIHSFPLETVSIYNLLLKPNGISPLKITAIPLTEVTLELVNANMGMMCLPKWALKYFNIPKDLVFKRIGKKGLKRVHYLVLRKKDADKKYLKDFMQNIEEEFVPAT
jgi:LysR family transcriptional regulator for metE and metH